MYNRFTRLIGEINRNITLGIIFQHSTPFSIHDGPWIRTTVFLKRMSFTLSMVLNPESQRANPEKMLDAVTKNQTRGRTEKNSTEIIDDVLKTLISMKNLVVALPCLVEKSLPIWICQNYLKKLRKIGLHTANRNDSFCWTWKFVDLIQYVWILFIHDLKHYNTLKHKRVVGVNNHLIIKIFIMPLLKTKQSFYVFQSFLISMIL